MILPGYLHGRILASIGTLVVIFAVIYVTVIFLLYLAKPFYSANIDYRGKHVVVTGGSSGIGLEVAKEYLKRGSNVTIMARNQHRLDAAVDMLRTHCTPEQTISTVSVDCASSVETVTKALSPVIENVGDVDVLINCAGTSVAAEFEHTDPCDFERMLRINVLGSVYPTRAVIAGMKKNRRGRIVFVSSQVAHVAIYGYSAYAASKWALRGLAESLQMELKPFSIYVSVAFPPDTDTPGYELEMQTKPELTKKLSEDGKLFASSSVALDIVNGSTAGLFSVSSGLDGWLLKQLHPGMSPLNNIWEVVEGIVFGSIARVISVYVLISWDKLCDGYIRDRAQPQEPCGLNTALFVSAKDSAQHGGCIRYASAEDSGSA